MIFCFTVLKTTPHACSLFLSFNGCGVGIDEKYGCINKNGEYVINPMYDGGPLNKARNEGFKFSQGLCLVASDERFGYIDQNGKLKINFIYLDGSTFFDDGYAIVATKDKKYTLIDKDGNEFGGLHDAIRNHSWNWCDDEECYVQISANSEYPYCGEHLYERIVAYLND